MAQRVCCNLIGKGISAESRGRSGALRSSFGKYALPIHQTPHRSNRSVTTRARYNERPFFRTGKSVEDHLEDFLTGVVDAVFTASKEEAATEIRLPVDLFEEDNLYNYYADIPDVREEDFKITMKDGLLTISGKRATDPDPDLPGRPTSSRKMRQLERPSGNFYRQLVLPSDADPSSIIATVNKGVLGITILKMIEAFQSEAEDVEVHF